MMRLLLFIGTPPFYTGMHAFEVEAQPNGFYNEYLEGVQK
jgi:hypothetical protein